MRFLVVCDDMIEYRGGVLLLGYVNGTVKAGDDLFVINPDRSFYKRYVSSLEIQGGKKMPIVKDEMVFLRIPDIKKEDIVLPCVISDENLQEDDDEHDLYEPYIRALCFEENDHHLLNHQIELKKEIDENNLLTLIRKHEDSFVFLLMKKDKLYFPLFTGVDAVLENEGILYQKGENVMTMVFSGELFRKYIDADSVLIDPGMDWETVVKMR